MASALAKATEALIEAAIKEAASDISAASKDGVAQLKVGVAELKVGVAELRHIHGAADNLPVALESLEKSILGKLEQLGLYLVSQTRVLSLQAALARAGADTFEYRMLRGGYSSGSSSSVHLVTNILKNALRGLPSSIPSEAASEDGTTYSAQAFRSKLVDHLHGMTGIRPVVEVGQDGKTYMIRIP